MVEKIENYAKPATVNPWIKELEGFAEGDAFAEVVTPNIRKDKETGEDVSSIAGAKSKIQDAARAHGLTARETERETLDDGRVRLVFVLGPRQKSGPKPAESAAEKAPKPGK